VLHSVACVRSWKAPLDTVQMPTATHSDRCLETFYCSSAVSGWWAIEPCLFERHSLSVIKYWYHALLKICLLFGIDRDQAGWSN